MKSHPQICLLFQLISTQSGLGGQFICSSIYIVFWANVQMRLYPQFLRATTVPDGEEMTPLWLL